MAKLKRVKDLFIGDKIYCISNDYTSIDILTLSEITLKDSFLLKGVSQYKFDNISETPSICKFLTRLIFENDLNNSILYSCEYKLFVDKQQAINVLQNSLKEIQDCITKLKNNG